jgi:EpsI family protein
MFDFAFLRSVPAILVSVMLGLEAIAFYIAPTEEYVPNPPPLSTFSSSVGPWRMLQEMELDADTQKILKADDALNRVYTGPEGPLTLYVAFFKSQRGGVTPHSPKICLPGSGWTPEGSRTIHLDVPGSGSIPVNRYVVRRGEERSVVLYWYATAHSEIADEYVSKLYLMYEGLRYHRSDAAVYRVIARVGPDGEEAAERKAIGFVNTFYPPLKQRMWTN